MVQLFSSLSSGAAYRSQQFASADMLEYNAFAAEIEAGEYTRAAAARASIIREEGEATYAKQEAAYGAAGVQLTGSPLRVLADTAKKTEADISEIMYQGKSRALAARNEAKVLRQKSESLREAGDEAFWLGLGSGLTQGVLRKSLIDLG